MAAHILVIDDTSSSRELLKFRLEGWGYRVTLAVDGEDGIAKIDAEMPDLILCEIIMPKKDGYDVCSYTRQKGSKVPLLFLTGKTEVDATVLGIRLGADDYMVKPFDMQDLKGRIEKLLARNPA